MKSKYAQLLEKTEGQKIIEKIGKEKFENVYGFSKEKGLEFVKRDMTKPNHVLKFAHEMKSS